MYSLCTVYVKSTAAECLLFKSYLIITVVDVAVEALHSTRG